MKWRTVRAARSSQRGSATVLVLAATGLIMFVGLALAGVAAIVVAHRTAQAAADLAALAAASAAAAGTDVCAAAGISARANAASLSGCQQFGAVVAVTVGVDGPRLLGRDYDVTAEARAGPGAGGE